MSSGIARDLSAKLQGRLAEVLERELGIFQHVLDPAQLGEVMIEAAVMVVRTNAATIAGYGRSPAEIEMLFRSVCNSIVECVRSGEQNGIERAIAAVKERGA